MAKAWLEVTSSKMAMRVRVVSEDATRSRIVDTAALSGRSAAIGTSTGRAPLRRHARPIMRATLP